MIRNCKPPALALALSIALLVVSIGAIVIEHVGACGSCARHDGLWSLAAPMGAIGYAILTAIGFLGWSRVFTVMAALAAAVHTVLAATMLVQSRICLICVGAAALALALLIVVLIRSTSRLKIITCAYVPGLFLASAPVAMALAHEEAAKQQRDAFAQAIRSGRASDGQTTVVIQVFEQDHCGYCRDFREMYVPRLERDFGDRVRLRFLPATASSWVRRTPTIVIEAGAIYEGLPQDYAELHTAVEVALANRK